MSVVNPPLHPQLLFLGFSSDDGRLTRMKQLAGRSKALADSGELNGLRLADWDALVIEGVAVPYQASGMHVLAFSSPNLGPPAGSWANLLMSGAQPSPTYSISEDLPADVLRLVRSETAPWLEAQEKLPYFQLHAIGTGGPTSPRDVDQDKTQDWIAVVRDADKNVILGAFERAQGGKWCWAVPHRSDAPELWLSVAMATWRAVNPGSFPDVDAWRAREPWLTNAERVSRSAIEELRADQQRAMEKFRHKEMQANAEMLAASREAEKTARRLLVSQGDELVDAVQTALRSLGFDVHDLDTERSAEGLPRVEDLHVACADEPELTVIVEVKGYVRGGAKASDLIQIGQHALRFSQREQRVPDRCWYVVNQFAATDPDTRQRPLAGASEDVEVFAQAGGLIIDTRDLFRLSQAVDAELVESSEARESLLAQRGVFTFDAP